MPTHSTDIQTVLASLGVPASAHAGGDLRSRSPIDLSLIHI